MFQAVDRVLRVLADAIIGKARDIEGIINNLLYQLILNII